MNEAATSPAPEPGKESPLELQTPAPPPAAAPVPADHVQTGTMLIHAPPLTKNLPEGATAEPEHAASKPTAFQTWLKTNLPSIEETMQKNVANAIYSALGPVGQAFGFLLGFGFVPIYVYYFLAEEENITKHWHEYVPLRHSRLRDEVVSVLAEISTSLVSYFRGQIVWRRATGC